MTMTAHIDSTSAHDQTATLYVGMELSASAWKVAARSASSTIRTCQVPAGDLEGLATKLSAAARKLGLGGNVRTILCQEAGRDGFWIHRALEEAGCESLVVDSSSIEVNRRARRAKTDRLDAKKLVEMLIRHDRGEHVWSVLRVPTPEEEDARGLHRERKTLQKELFRERNRVRSLLVRFGIRPKKVSSSLRVEALRDWRGEPLPQHAKTQLQHMLDRMKLLEKQLQDVGMEQKERLKTNTETGAQKANVLKQLKGIGDTSAEVLAYEFFWRTFDNRRQVGSAAGLTGTPYQSGGSNRDQGISKAGSPRIRALMVELAWFWLRFQPESESSQWFERKWGNGSGRSRRVGIVALARRLLVELWRYVELGVVPNGAVFKGEKTAMAA